MKKCIGAAAGVGELYVLAADVSLGESPGEDADDLAAVAYTGKVYRRVNREDAEFEEYPDGTEFDCPRQLVMHQSGMYVASGTSGVYRYSQLGDNPEVELEYGGR